ncbi:dTDP-4-dehydrorhamnose 3,5-epimerase [Kitasatospora sp. NBC_01250]|uniref:dTDP-4-dehydrorhamnose 3,5-epimerase family protein n=1 Tax=Kitasatospora sp. NBC_01250 TaxID=2903571 RepID=UPI002E3485CD|nr:dTDP-4-dehydrorhamnose 3,5-epimerase [Kitasatospora sp. NBC_01250]
MKTRQLTVPGAWEIELDPHHDERGTFAEWYAQGAFAEALGTPLPVALAAVSISRRGVVRGVHYVETPPGQARYVTCVSGEILDFTVDIRTGSPTFGQWDSLRLGPGHWRALYLTEGLGHAFTALTEQATVLYLCSAPYAAERERTIHPFDPDLALPWPTGLEPNLSERDAQAPTLAQARQLGRLPRYTPPRP